MHNILIGVMGPGENADRQDMDLAFLLGKRIAQEGWTLLSGGRNAGVMDAVNRGAKEAGGLTVGIIPDKDTNRASQFLDIAILTDMGSARNNINVLSSKIVVACGKGEAGTVSEIALAIKAKKQVILLGAHLEVEKAMQLIGKHLVTVAQTVEDVIQQIKQLV
ncbi:MAG: TIGR00725 family protein [Candidatus Kerfeldbacteria bacterium]|nr:TIGR00725 family protein [Candidatus Kerfeldbacteria bacterium]